MFLQIPTFASPDTSFLRFASPRMHEQINEEINSNRPFSLSPHQMKKRLQSFHDRSLSDNFPSQQSKDSSNHNIEQSKRQNNLQTNKKFIDMKHFRSFTSSLSKSKFYSFKKIKEEKCKQQSNEARVIKSMKYNPQNTQKSSHRNKIIQHLDEVTTVVSKNSPRSSLNSLFTPQVQESLILMKGADLYDELLKENNTGRSRFFQQIKNGKDHKNMFETPLLKKQLSESRDWTNTNDTTEYAQKNYDTEPRKHNFINQLKNPTDDDRFNIHSFLRHLDSNSLQNNKLSFLRAKKSEKKF